VPGYSLVHWLGRDGTPILSTDLVEALASTLGLALAAGVPVQVVHDEARAAARLLPPTPRHDDPDTNTQAEPPRIERETGE